MNSTRPCRFCKKQLEYTFVDLGLSPLSNEYVPEEKIKDGQSFFPLHAYVCGNCFLVQLEEFRSPEGIFSDYAYFSSYSNSWLEHCKAFAAKAIEINSLSQNSLVVEVASNDGYLLRYFKESGVPVLGVEPAANVAAVAKKEHGIESIVKFFGVQTAEEMRSAGQQADLLVGNNVLAHVPDINDFVGGLKIVLKPGGVLNMEFPHLLRLMEDSQFDTIYHEHFSYLSLVATTAIFKAHGLRIFDLEQLPTHGGSLRIYACHEDDSRATNDIVTSLLNEERTYGLEKVETYTDFAVKTNRIKQDLLEFLIKEKKAGKRIVGYGAPAKGNTLLNYCGIRTDFLDYTVDRNPYKQGTFTPGTLIPIHAPEKIMETKPDFVLILPWNLKHEIMEQMSFIREWNGKFVIPIPSLQVL